MVTRLPFKLPEFAPRITWASTAAREVWEIRISRISNAWLQAERDFVAASIRLSALQPVTPEALPVVMAEEARRGLTVLPLTLTARATGYQSASRTLQNGDKFDYRCAFTRPEFAGTWADAWGRSDDAAIGSLLGYPTCCRKWFQEIWVGARWFDTTVPMALLPAPLPLLRSAQATGQPAPNPRSEGAQRRNEGSGEGVEVRGVNMLWRWFGVRPVSHLPCSFSCGASIALAERHLDEMGQRFPAEAAWMREILSWPVKFTSFRGIGELTTPIFRASVPTDALAERVEIRYLGEGYPAEGVKGLSFPFRRDATPPLTIQIARPSAQNPAVNGFSSLAAMNEAHRALLAVAGPGPYRTVVDLGCGDGTLLSKIPAQRRIGVERDPGIAECAKQRLDRVILGDCSIQCEQFWADENTAVDLVIAQRDRNPPETLRGYTVLSYSYEAGAEPPKLIGPDGREHVRSGRTGDGT